MQLNFSGFARRALARYTDTAIIWLPFVAILNYYLGASSNLEELVANAARLVAFVILPTLIISPLYSTIAISYFKTTIGKALAGLTVQLENGNRLSFKRSFFRQTFGYMLSGTIVGLGYFSMIRHAKKQTWHDELVGTVVVKTHDLWLLGLVVLLALITIHIYFILQIIAKIGEVATIFQIY